MIGVEVNDRESAVRGVMFENVSLHTGATRLDPCPTITLVPLQKRFGELLIWKGIQEFEESEVKYMIALSASVPISWYIRLSVMNVTSYMHGYHPLVPKKKATRLPFRRAPRSTVPGSPNAIKQNGIIAFRLFTSVYVSRPPQTKSSNPSNPATAPNRFPAIFLPTAPDFGAAVLLVLGPEADDDELEDAGAEELDEAAAEFEVAAVVEVVEVANPCDREVALAMIGFGVTRDVVSVRITFGTEAVEAKVTVAAETGPSAAEDAPAPAVEAASDADASELWIAAEA